VGAGAAVGEGTGASTTSEVPSDASPAGSAPAGAAPGLRPLVDDAGLGELADQYELLAELGRGGSAVVYRARDRRLGREVALKAVRLAPALSVRDRAAEVARLAREARTTARLDHPHIVPVFAVHELRDGLAVVMRYVPGRSLKQLLADEGALDPAHAVRLMVEVAGALDYAHAHGVVHRDVKPENIFVDAASGRALLADFGAARAGEGDVRVTRTGATVGTPAYMSPEQIDGGPVDGRADLYSLGLVAWETLAGRRPWAGAGLYQLLHHQKHDVLPPLAAVRPPALPPVPLPLEYVVARLLEKRPAARWPSAAVLAAQLEHPVLPADYKLWVREHRRRLAEFAAGARAGDAARVGVSAMARTEQFRPGHPGAAEDGSTVAVPVDGGVAADGGASGAPAPPLPNEDAPSWARPRRGGRWRWLAVGAVAAAALVTVPAALRSRADAPARPRPGADGGEPGCGFAGARGGGIRRRGGGRSTGRLAPGGRRRGGAIRRHCAGHRARQPAQQRAGQRAGHRAGQRARWERRPGSAHRGCGDRHLPGRAHAAGDRTRPGGGRRAGCGQAKCGRPVRPGQVRPGQVRPGPVPPRWCRRTRRRRWRAMPTVGWWSPWAGRRIARSRARQALRRRPPPRVPGAPVRRRSASAPVPEWRRCRRGSRACPRRWGPAGPGRPRRRPSREPARRDPC
jgi:hypothetical protein